MATHLILRRLHLILTIPLEFLALVEDPKFSFTDASLTKFNYTTATNNTLYYNLNLGITIRNPDKRATVDYLGIQVTAHYQETTFSVSTLSSSIVPFHQGHKNTTILQNIVIWGQQYLVGFEECDRPSKFKSETATGVFSIDLQLPIQAKLFKFFLGERPYTTNLDCRLMVPLMTRSSSMGTSVGRRNFNATKRFDSSA